MNSKALTVPVQPSIEVWECHASDPWPFTIPKGRVCYSEPNDVVFRTPDGQQYALNGIAQHQGFPPIDLIWRDDPANPGGKIPLTAWIECGLQLKDYA